MQSYKAADVRKHSMKSSTQNGCGYTPLAMETHGAWGAEARRTILFIESRISILTNQLISKSMVVVYNLYGKPATTLI